MLPAMTTSSPSADGLAARIAERSWYHVMELAPGVTTPGWFDLRPSASIVPLPASLEGKRCLDVGTWDGFWAFEMERRGASEVLAIDIDDPDRWDWPPHSRLGGDKEQRQQFLAEFKSDATGFRLAHEVLGSRVERMDLSVYELSPERVGTFDVVFLGSLLLHLRDPVLALDRLRSVCSGEAVIADTIDAIPTIVRPRTPVARLEGLDQSWWWMPNRCALHRMVRSAGFEILDSTPMYFVPTGPAHPFPPLTRVFRSLATAAGRERLVIRMRGIPHAAVRARPV
jgi:tRNA (mo5U34)-methyltransferase